ncbi:MAG: PxKF domain-containing protein, partial [Chloroflexota bacterium]|nr:PxKF domain-containing protein [Chloroflexota bacterium]
SGIDPSTAPADSTITGEGSNLGASESVSDKAGNVGLGSVSGIKIDRTAPMITASASGPTGSNGWYVGPVTVHFECSDGLSLIATCPADVVLSADGAGQSASGTAVDNAGNSAEASLTGINIDQTAPTINGSRTPAANANGWNNSPVTVSFSCADATSGISAPGGCTSPMVLNTEGTGQSVIGTAIDNAGNTANATVDQINIDLTKPLLTLPGNTAVNASGLSGAVVTYSTSASDPLSGFAGGSTTTLTCVRSDAQTGFTFAPGTTTTITCSATDLAGNTATGSFTVTVNPFYFQGFFQPIDNGDVWNTIKGGQTVPVKWKLFLYQGGPEITTTDSVAPGWPKYVASACTTSPQDAVETTGTGSTTLRYDTTGKQFIYNWQTPAGSGCYRLDVKFTDGRTYSAQFKTNK